MDNPAENNVQRTGNVSTSLFDRKLTRSSTRVLVLDREWNILFVDRGAAEAFERSGHSLTGKPFWKLFPELIDTDFYGEAHLAVSEQIERNYEGRLQQGGPDYLIHYIPSEDGLAIILTRREEDSASARSAGAPANVKEALRTAEPLSDTPPSKEDSPSFDLAGQSKHTPTRGDDQEAARSTLDPTGFQLSRTIQALQESEERLRHALARSPIVVFTQDRDLRYTWIHNPALGMAPDQVVGMTDHDILQPEDAARTVAVKRHVLKTGEPAREEVNILYNGRDTWWDLWIDPLRDDKGAIAGVRCVATEITERKLAETALRESEARFRTMADWLPFIVWVHDAEGKQQFVNRTFAEYFGVRAEEMTGDKWLELTHSDDGAAYYTEFIKSVREQVPFHASVRVRRADGTWRWIESFGRPRFTESGDFLGIVGTSIDVTERKQAESALRESEARLQQTLAIDTVGVVFWSSDIVIRQVNDAFLSMTGFDREDVIGKSWRDFTPERFHEVSENAICELQEAGEITPYEKEYFRKDGSRWWGLFTARQINEDEVVEFVLDITAQKQSEEALRESEERYRLAARATNDAIWDWDLDGDTIEWNQALTDLFGWEERETSGDWWIERIHPDDRARVESSIGDVIGGVSDYVTIEYHFLRRDGTYAEVLDRGYVLRSEDGKPLRMIGAMMDFSEIRRAEAELRELNEKLEQRVAERTVELENRNTELQQFAYVASHDMQEPLRKIQTFADLTRSDFAEQLGEEGRFYLDRMQSSAARMSQILADLLAFSRVSTRQQPPTWTSVRDVINDVLSDLEFAVAMAEATVEQDAEVPLEVDVRQFRQLLNHLVMNALKFRREGVPPRVHITAEIISGDAGTCRIVVEDNGIGFDERYAERIFEPFERLHGKAAYPGTGMGLAICRRIVERHSGTIKAESQPGEGSRFIIELPVRQEIKGDWL